MDFSIVIPTWNRSHLLDTLLKSLFEERNRYKQGKTEVLVVDSSKDTEKENIVKLCKMYDAVYIEGDDSVRKKETKELESHNMSISFLLILMWLLKKGYWMNMSMDTKIIVM